MKFLEEFADWFIYPTLLVWMVYYDSARIAEHPVAWACAFAAGWVAWTLAEYWIHRSVLHGFYWMGIHQRHHVAPRELTRFPLWQIPSYFLAIYVAVYVVAGTWTLAAYSGVILGWIMFFMMHTTMHHFPRFLPRFSIRHNAHHKLTVMNYGITVDWWDRVFGTYRKQGGPTKPKPNWDWDPTGGTR